MVISSMQMEMSKLADSVDDLMNRTFLRFIPLDDNSEAEFERVIHRELPYLMTQKNVKLVVIDSITSVFEAAASRKVMNFNSNREIHFLSDISGDKSI